MSDPTSLAGGRYLLVERLGDGGMATVYRAFDQRLQVWRAVKVLLPEFAQKSRLVARFENEAQTMALLEHPNIVRVYDVDHDGQHAYIVMELVEGGSLVDWLERHGPMPARMAIDVIVEVCQAIGFANDKDVIHRDVKPHNVLVDSSGICKVTDFGIARAGDTDRDLTKTGAVMGTWGYMAPEQRTDSKHVDQGADVYAVAATLYSLVTDTTPMDLFAADRDASILEGVPEAMVPVLIKATEYRRSDRFENLGGLAAALLKVRDALDPDPASTPPLLHLPDGPPPARPNPVAQPEPADDIPRATILPENTEPELEPVPSAPARMPEQDFGAAPAGGEQLRRAVAGAPQTRPDTALEPSGTSPTLLIGLLGGVFCAVVLLLWMRGAPEAVPTAPDPVARTPAAATPSIAMATPEVATPPVAAAVATPQPGAKVTPPVVTPAVVAPPVATPTPAPAATPKPTPTPRPATPRPTPRPAKQSFEKVNAPAVGKLGASAPFSAKTSQKEDVVLHYRPMGSGPWYQKRLSFALGQWRGSINLTDEYAKGMDWYLSSKGVTYGSSSRPKRMQVR